METKLRFEVTLDDGTVEIDEIPCPVEMVPKQINNVFMHYAQMGMLRGSGNHITLIPSHRIMRADIDVPSLVIANERDVTNTAQASENLSKIIKP